MAQGMSNLEISSTCDVLLRKQLINRSNLMAQSLWFFGSRLNIVADHTTTGGQYDLIEGYFPPGTQTPPHRHTRYSEQLYVLSGEFTVWAGEKQGCAECW